ncbi:MAG: NAD(+) synthase [Oscillospiraceae bacterium]|jgi:NAD+ synthase (glutamine-hydrolysing)|nr:NAD(+) synthase [Oscillospiraceae bacterium]
MKNIVRVAVAVNEVTPGNPNANLASAQLVLAEAQSCNPDLIVFPANFLVGGSSADLLKNKAVSAAACDALEQLLSLDERIVVNTKTGSPDSLHPEKVNILAGDLNLTIILGTPKALAEELRQSKLEGSNALILRSCEPVTAGKIKQWRDTAKLLSAAESCAVILANGGVGESTSPNIYKGFAGIYECGEELAFNQDSREGFVICADLDADIIGASSDTYVTYEPILLHKKENLLRPVRKNPYIPEDRYEADAYLDELFELQVASLAGRMKATGIKKAVVGVSGGLDSTLALLVSAEAIKALHLPASNLVGISMPGFGTTDRTYNNALSLIEALGAKSREISIREAVLQHFEDIEHSPENHDTTYENAQARERCQILLDVANQEGGLVIGTGDLTEEALGWCTYGGDHLASYNVNTSITKSMARLIVKRLAESSRFIAAADILLDILDTPVSPELLPPDGSGEMVQQSEKILGSFELHEFFTYYFVKYSMAPSKILRYAIEAFEVDYSTDYIKDALKTFIRRHLAGQFKRACGPDGANIGDISVAAAFYSIPSDLSPEFLLAELDGEVWVR